MVSVKQISGLEIIGSPFQFPSPSFGGGGGGDLGWTPDIVCLIPRYLLAHNVLSVDNLMQYVKLKTDAHLVDLTRSRVTVETLTETKITCTTEEKVSPASMITLINAHHR